MIPHRVAGIPCQVRVLWAEAYRPAYLWGPPERCYPAEGPECEWEITDRRGRHAPWLEKKLTDQDRRLINRIVLGGGQ